MNINNNETCIPSLPRLSISLSEAGVLAIWSWECVPNQPHHTWWDHNTVGLAEVSMFVHSILEICYVSHCPVSVLRLVRSDATPTIEGGSQCFAVGGQESYHGMAAVAVLWLLPATFLLALRALFPAKGASAPRWACKWRIPIWIGMNNHT